MNDSGLMQPGSPTLACRGLSKSFSQGDQRLDVLRDVDFSIARGDCAAVVGQSGSGKSTLLHLLGGLDKPSKCSSASLRCTRKQTRFPVGCSQRALERGPMKSKWVSACV